MKLKAKLTPREHLMPAQKATTQCIIRQGSASDEPLAVRVGSSPQGKPECLKTIGLKPETPQKGSLQVDPEASPFLTILAPKRLAHQGLFAHIRSPLGA